MAWARALRVNAVFVSKRNAMKVPTLLQSALKTAKENILLDSGATGNFMDQRMINRLGFKPLRLPTPKRMINVDGTDNHKGTIKYFMDLHVTVGDKTHLETFYIADLGQD